MHLHFLGICGTFMGSLALLAREMGHRVSGCDLNVYPPMSTQLEEQGIVIHQGYDSAQFAEKPDLVIIGNALSRGNEAVEYVLNNQLPYCSGPQWLSEHLLYKRWVLAVAGTHGKTTTTSMLAWILEKNGFEPGFLIGGVPANFSSSARLGKSDFFVIEADEYDTAFFDKRSKFIHYHPRTLILNNLEFDHADIFEDITDIQKQFQHLLRIVPSQGKVIYPDDEPYLKEVIEKGLWSEASVLSTKDNVANQEWQVKKLAEDGGEFEVINHKRNELAHVSWQLIGEHNLKNAFAACVAAHHIGISLQQSAEALASFQNVKRRLEKLAEVSLESGKQLSVFDDFAHHPSAITTTLQALRSRYPDDTIIAVLEPRSNTMKMGVHGKNMALACETADLALWYTAENLALAELLQTDHSFCFQSIPELQKRLDHYVKQSSNNVRVVFMSNGGFSGIQKAFVESLKN